MRRHVTQSWSRIACGLLLSIHLLACDSGAESSPDNGPSKAGRSGSKSTSSSKGGTGGSAVQGGKGGSKAESGGAGGASGAGGQKASAAGSGSKTESDAKGGSGGKAASAQDCHEGEPKETADFLDHCTDSQCEPFDNAKRLPLYNNGDLPKLP